MDPQPHASHDPRLILASPIQDPPAFPFLSLPTELRLKIYTHLLPPRHHKIVTQIPTTGNFFFYNTLSLPANSSYPFGRSPPKSPHPTKPKYKVLSENFRPDFPDTSIHTEILRTCRTVRHEAEPILYGGRGVEWDFGLHLEAMREFWEERSQLARESVRELKIAKEIPCFEGTGGMDEKWVGTTMFLREKFSGLRRLDLTIWCASGLITAFPCLRVDGSESEERNSREARELGMKRWREWEWTSELLKMGELQMMRITWWGFQNVRNEMAGRFDSWLAGRMLGDAVFREKIIREGDVVEGVIMIPVGG